jgi:hypothetical protein
LNPAIILEEKCVSFLFALEGNENMQLEFAKKENSQYDEKYLIK